MGLLLGGLIFGLAVSRPAEPEPAMLPPSAFQPRFPRFLWAGGTIYLVGLVLYLLLDKNPLVIAAWAAAVLLLIAADARIPDFAAWRTRTAWLDVGLPLGLILLAGLWLRLWHLNTLPLAISGDTVSHGTQSLGILTGADPGIIGLGWAFIPRLGFLPEVITMAVFGQTWVGLNLAAVLAGMASLVGVYLLGRELYGPRVGWLAAGLLAVSYTHIYFSRVAPYIHPLPWVTFGLYFLVASLRSGRGFHAILAGITAGVASQMYYSGRIVVFMLALVGVYLLLKRRLSWRQWALVALGFLVVFGPNLIVILRDWNGFMARTREVSLFNPAIMQHLGGKYGGLTPLQVLIENCKRSFLTFSYFGNAWGEHDLGRPFFDSLTAVLLALGLGYVLARPRRFASWLLFAGFVITVLLSTALTSDPPFWQRLIVVMPIAGILAAVALDRLARLIPAPAPILSIGALVLLVVLGQSNWSYFQRHEVARTTALAQAARFAADLPPGETLVVVRPPWLPEYYEFRFLAPQVRGVSLAVEDIEAGKSAELAPPAVMLFTPEFKDRVLPALQAAWPGGVLQEFTLPTGQPSFLSYNIEPE